MRIEKKVIYQRNLAKTCTELFTLALKLLGKIEGNIFINYYSALMRLPDKNQLSDA